VWIRPLNVQLSQFLSSQLQNPKHPNNKSSSLFNINRITIFGFHSSQLQNTKNKSKSPQIRKKKHHNLQIFLGFHSSQLQHPKTNQEVLKLEKETSQSSNLGFHSSQLRKRNNKSRNPLSINTFQTNS
jgi:hypothetical protein